MNESIPTNSEAGHSAQGAEVDRRVRHRRISSSELLGSLRELVIEHGGSEYRLRITSNDKLILTK